MFRKPYFLGVQYLLQITTFLLHFLTDFLGLEQRDLMKTFQSLSDSVHCLAVSFCISFKLLHEVASLVMVEQGPDL